MGVRDRNPRRRREPERPWASSAPRRSAWSSRPAPTRPCPFRSRRLGSACRARCRRDPDHPRSRGDHHAAQPVDPRHADDDHPHPEQQRDDPDPAGRLRTRSGHGALRPRPSGVVQLVTVTQDLHESHRRVPGAAADRDPQAAPRSGAGHAAAPRLGRRGARGSRSQAQPLAIAAAPQGAIWAATPSGVAAFSFRSGSGCRAELALERALGVGPNSGRRRFFLPPHPPIRPLPRYDGGLRVVRKDDVQGGEPARSRSAGAPREPRDLPQLPGGEAGEPASSAARPGPAAGPGGGSRLIPIRALPSRGGARRLRGGGSADRCARRWRPSGFAQT